MENDIDYTYVFGGSAKKSIKLIGYFKNKDYENNLVNYEFNMDSLKTFIYDRACNYLNDPEIEDEWQIDYKEKKQNFEFEEEELE